MKIADPALSYVYRSIKATKDRLPPALLTDHPKLRQETQVMEWIYEPTSGHQPTTSVLRKFCLPFRYPQLCYFFIHKKY